jgi:L-ascorbate metabolism protein UlaG (beta-lactamase superfamily)
MSSLTITRITHACALLDFGGATILTDPWFSERPTYHPGEPIALQPPELPPLAGVIISHGHYDHCDLRAFAGYPDKTVPFAVKRGLAAKVRATGFGNVTELDPWQTTSLGGVTITAAPARHQVPEVTFLLGAGGHTAFFGGDTLLIPELTDIGRRFPSIDVALLPINGLRIRPLLNKQVVMDAHEAAALTKVLHPAVAIPIHYAFTGGCLGDRLLVKHDGNPQDYQDAASDLAPETAVHILAPGTPLTI